MLYRLLRPLARFAARLFHRRLRVEQAGNVPSRGPVILAANHPNMMLDVLLLAGFQRRRLHFLAKATLFRNPLLRGGLRAAGVLPVYRRQESTGDASRNDRTFEACHELLAKGGAIAIFPEGVSHERNAVLPLKTGCARIALEAEAQAAYGLGVVIVPVGLAFSNREVFRSDALVVFGEPLSPASHFDAYRDGRTTEAVRRLTAELETALKKLTLHVPREEDEELIRTLRGFFTEREEPLFQRLEIDRTLVDAVAYFRDRSPVEYQRLRRDVLRYGRVLEALGMAHAELDRSYRPGPVLRYALPRLLLASLGFPLFAVGALVHYLPYKIPAWVARACAKDPVERATTKLTTGLVSFPIFYLLLGVLLTHWLGLGAGLATVVLLLLLGLFALLYLEGSTGWLEEARIFALHLGRKETLSRLREWGGRLVTELEARRLEYEALENRPAE
jgi:glycerol-3-phosphate O-acyltransferase/dihydroxyacetone phosphate acyltransferase